MEMRSYIKNELRSEKNDQVFFFLLTFLYVSFYLPMGSSIPTLLLLVFYIRKNRFTLTIRFSFFSIYCIAFALFCYLTYFWAKETYYVLRYSRSVLKIMFGMLIVHMCILNDHTVDVMLRVIVWGGYVMMFYMVAFYGIDGLVHMVNESERMTNDVMNANYFAMCISYACVIHVYFGLTEKWSFTHLLMIPAATLLAISGSRKGLIILIGGVVCVVMLTVWQRERSLKTLVKLFSYLLGLVIGFILVINLPVFSVMKSRITNLLALLSGSSDVDKSLLSRSDFIKIGISVFKEHPLVGVGIDNARLFNYRNVYLHNNFVEMLANGGIIGFFVYYSMYIYLFIQYFKNRKTTTKYYSICLVLLIFMTAMHYAFVSYRIAGEYYMLLICYVQMEQCRKKDDKNGEFIAAAQNAQT